jgi:hypothetical protein
MFQAYFTLSWQSTVCVCFNLNVNLIDMAFKSVTLRWTEHKSQKKETKQPYRVLMRKLLVSDDMEECKDGSIILR